MEKKCILYTNNLSIFMIYIVKKVSYNVQKAHNEMKTFKQIIYMTELL